MALRKYKYYFKKPRSEIAKDILSDLLIAGSFFIAITSPYFIRNLLAVQKQFKKYPKRKVWDTFYNLKRQGLIKIREHNHQLYISLTPEGRKKAGILQIDRLKIRRPRKWDKKWRLVIFDIAQLKVIHRNAFRGQLKDLGFFPLQKSVWIYPFDCQAEIDLLKDFFGLSEKEVRLIVAEKIGKDANLKKHFKLS